MTGVKPAPNCVTGRYLIHLTSYPFVFFILFMLPTKEKTGLEPAHRTPKSHLLFPSSTDWATSPWFFTPYSIILLTSLLLCHYLQNIPIQSVHPLWWLTFSLVKPMRLLPSSYLMFSQQFFTPLSDYLSEIFQHVNFFPFRGLL